MKDLQISQDWPLTATLELSFYSKTNHQSDYTSCHIFRSYGSLFNFYLCIVWGVLTDGRGGTSAIYRWEKVILGELLINLFIPAPNPAIDWIFWTPPAWHFDFTSDSPRLIVYLQWSSWSIIILSFIMPKVAQWSLIVISRSNQPIDAPPSSIENLFSWHDLSKMIDLLIPVLTRDNVLSSYKTTFDWLHLDQSRLANQMYNNLPIASCCTVDIPCST